MAELDAPWPTDIKVSDGGKRLSIAFEDGSRLDIAAELLRVMSPSAEVQGHSRRERKTIGGKRHVAIIGADPVGSYAVRLSFDDMHSTGIFTWSYLHELGTDGASRWEGYLADLERHGLDRDRAGEAAAGN